MNEDERGITPAGVTAISLEHLDTGGWRVVIEQGNGDVIKMIDLTEMERIQLGLMLDSAPGTPPLMDDVSFLDPDRDRAAPYPAVSHLTSPAAVLTLTGRGGPQAPA